MIIWGDAFLYNCWKGWEGTVAIASISCCFWLFSKFPIWIGQFKIFFNMLDTIQCPSCTKFIILDGHLLGQSIRTTTKLMIMHRSEQSVKPLGNKQRKYYIPVNTTSIGRTRSVVCLINLFLVFYSSKLGMLFITFGCLTKASKDVIDLLLPAVTPCFFICSSIFIYLFFSSRMILV